MLTQLAPKFHPHNAIRYTDVGHIRPLPRCPPHPSESLCGVSTPLASYACRVQQQLDNDVEPKLVDALSAWLMAALPTALRIGEPHSVVLGSELLSCLAARLRCAPWKTVVTAVPGTASHAAGVNRAMLLLGLVLRLVHPVDDDFGSSAQPSTHVLQTPMRQVCADCYPAGELNARMLRR